MDELLYNSIMIWVFAACMFAFVVGLIWAGWRDWDG